MNKAPEAAGDSTVDAGLREKIRGPEAAESSFFSEPVFWLWVAGVGGVTLVFGLQSYYPSYIGPLSNVFPTAGALTMLVSALACWRRYGLGTRSSFELVWLLFSAGAGLWVAAESTWAAYYFVLNIPVPYPSVADLFYVGGYFPIIAALGLYLRAFSSALSRKGFAVAMVAILCFVALALGLILPTELSLGLSAFGLLTDLAYPLLDLSLFALTLLCLAIFLGGAISKWWILFGGASMLYVIADEYFLYQIATNTYYNGNVDDLIFILGYLTFALAFYAHRREF